MKRIILLGMLLILGLALASTARATALFHDDFEDGNDDGWTRVKRVNAWTVTEGKYYLIGGSGVHQDGYVPGEPGYRDGFSYAHMNDPDWTDYVYEVTFDTTNAGGYPRHVHQVILKFRAQEPLFSEYRLDIWVPGDPSSSTHLSKYVNGVGAPLATAAPVAVLGTNTARILLHGGHIQVYVNGVEVIDFIDPSPIPYGGIGVGAIWEVEAWFDDITVMPLVVTATIDVVPDTLNLRSKGKWVTAYIELPTGYDVADVDLPTVALDSIVAEQDPKYDFVSDPSEYLVDHDEDGILERMIKFPRAEVTSSLSPGDVTLTVTGEVNGTPFEGSDTIQVR